MGVLSQNRNGAAILNIAISGDSRHEAEPKEVRRENVLILQKSARRTRRTHEPVVKAQETLAALREDKTPAELPKHFELHPNQITEWERQLLEQTSAHSGAGTLAIALVDPAPVHAQIGQLEWENDF